MADAVTNKVFQVFESFQNASIDAEVEGNVRNWANQQKVCSEGVLGKEEYVGSPLLKLLIENRTTFASSSGMAHVLYAPSSTGKTAACRYWVETILKGAGAPALMISGNGLNVNYLDYMAVVLRIRQDRSEAQWIASMVAGLSRQPGPTLKHAPVLVLDEFNSPGENNQNINFADSFARFIYERSLSVIFVTQNPDVAMELCKLNQWKRIGPLPGATIPDRWSLKKGELPPAEYNWKSMQWTMKGLTAMILRRKRYKNKFDDQVKDHLLEWLEAVPDPTSAIVKADEQLALQTGNYEYEIPNDLSL